MINKLRSIKEISQDDCFKTNGSRPVKVMCNDLDYHVCKYHCGKGFPYPLFNELLGGAFLKIWQLPVPDYSLVQINIDHVKETEIPYHCFEKTCFGSKFMGSYKEVDKFFLKMRSINAANHSGRNTFLKIAMFYIWLCNEDRHWDNLTCCLIRKHSNLHLLIMFNASMVSTSEKNRR